MRKIVLALSLISSLASAQVSQSVTIYNGATRLGSVGKLKFSSGICAGPSGGYITCTISSSVTADAPLSGAGTSASHLTCPTCLVALTAGAITQVDIRTTANIGSRIFSPDMANSLGSDNSNGAYLQGGSGQVTEDGNFGVRFGGTPIMFLGHDSALGLHADTVTLASADTIAPTAAITKVSGTTTINTITVPTGPSINGGVIWLLPTGAMALGTGGNIIATLTATANVPVICIWDGVSKWYCK